MWPHRATSAAMAARDSARRARSLSADRSVTPEDPRPRLPASFRLCSRACGLRCHRAPASTMALACGPSYLEHLHSVVVDAIFHCHAWLTQQLIRSERAIIDVMMRAAELPHEPRDVGVHRHEHLRFRQRALAGIECGGIAPGTRLCPQLLLQKSVELHRTPRCFKHAQRQV